MDTIDDTDWDLILPSTSLQNSLLALSLSRSGDRPGTRVLHLDKSSYYGAEEAAFSRSEAETWVEQHASHDSYSTSFGHAAVTSQPDEAHQEGRARLSPSRAYSLTLSPQLIYAKSALVSAVVSSQVHNQLDFQAVGSWFVLHPHLPTFSLTRLSRVPSGREDIFSDTTLDLRAKRALMKFLRFVSNYEEQLEIWDDDRQTPFPAFLEAKFGLPPTSHAAILSLTMSERSPATTTTGFALPRIAQHIRSIGVFGPGFGAVLPKWGGLAEIVQVACRACAVGGGTYMLNKSIASWSEKDEGSEKGRLQLNLEDGEKVSTRWLVGSEQEVHDDSGRTLQDGQTGGVASRSISIVSSPLTSLFPRTSEGGPIPAGAVIMVPSTDDHEPPVYILAHTSEAGECPMDQCVLYASVSLPADVGQPRLQQSVAALLDNIDERDSQNDRVRPVVLWAMHYQQRTGSFDEVVEIRDGVVALPPMASGLVFDDSVLENVKKVWQMITGEDESNFMQFEARGDALMGDEAL